MEAQSPLLEGSCQERSLDWRQERWETGWLGSQHYCGTAGVKPTEQHRIKDHGIDGRLESYQLLAHTAWGSWENHPLQQLLAIREDRITVNNAAKRRKLRYQRWHGLVWLRSKSRAGLLYNQKLFTYFFPSALSSITRKICQPTI